MTFPISEVSDLDLAFPANALQLMPQWEEIPEDFRRERSLWCRFVRDWFYYGLASYELKSREGVDEKKALRHLKAIMGSFQPKHEHKEAAVAFLLSQWFEDEPEWTAARGGR